MPHVTAHEVRDLIVDRLSSGDYPIGSRLPPARELANELGAHRNTVAKAYRLLAELGLVSLRQGRGTYVAARIDGNGRSGASTQLRDAVASLVAKARRLGVAEDELRRLVVDQITAVYRLEPPRAAFVECNQHDVEAAIAEIEAMTGIRLVPLLLDDLQADRSPVIDAVSVVCTSLFHVKDVSDRLAAIRPDVSVIGVYTHPDERALGELARINPGSVVGIVVSNAGGGRRFASQVNIVADVSTKVLVCPSDAQIRDLADEVDVIVCSRSRMTQVVALPLTLPVIALPFHVSPQSARRVLDALVERRVGGPASSRPSDDGSTSRRAGADVAPSRL
jgi:DNA-binding transcriptional regulator YhcF (GntR family)